jgi:hypothetical protein
MEEQMTEDFYVMKCGIKINKASELHLECMAFTLAMEPFPISKLLGGYRTAMASNRPDHAIVFRTAVEYRNPMRSVEQLRA